MSDWVRSIFGRRRDTRRCTSCGEDVTQWVAVVLRDETSVGGHTQVLNLDDRTVLCRRDALRLRADIRDAVVNAAPPGGAA